MKKYMLVGVLAACFVSSCARLVEEPEMREMTLEQTCSFIQKAAQQKDLKVEVTPDVPGRCAALAQIKADLKSSRSVAYASELAYLAEAEKAFQTDEKAAAGCKNCPSVEALVGVIQTQTPALVSAQQTIGRCMALLNDDTSSLEDWEACDKDAEAADVSVGLALQAYEAAGSSFKSVVAQGEKLGQQAKRQIVKAPAAKLPVASDQPIEAAEVSF